MSWTALMLGIGALSMGAADGVSWQPIGQTDLVTLGDDGAIELRVDEPATAGQVSSVITLPPGCDAVMVTADLDDAQAQAVTFAVHDAQTGDPLGYWQNPVAVEEPTREAAVLDLTQPVRRVRLFVGTDGRSSSASVGAVRVTPLRRAAAYRTMQYGAAVTADKTAGQTFTATGTRFGGLTLRLRFTQPLADATPPDLTARLYAWQGDAAATRAGDPLATVTIPGRLIPAGSRSIERDLMLPLEAPVTRGERYYVEVSAGAGASAPCLLFAGPDGIPGGQLYQGNRAVDWDLHTHIYNQRW